jgi:uncharacterized membrane protein (DUF4010 family)
MSTWTMNELTIQNLVDAATALGIGLLVGLEREQKGVSDQAADPDAPPPLLGVRTFALLGLFGWLAGHLAQAAPWTAAAAFLAVGALAVWSAVHEGTSKHSGLTTEVAALVTFAIGMTVHGDRMLAIALGLVTALLLVSKPWFTRLVPRMQRMDLTSTLQLLILIAIVLPVLPTTASDPWGVLAPRRIGIFVVLIAGIGYVGYVLHRVLGSRNSAGITGLVGGLASSTAVTVAMSQRARAAESFRDPAQLAIYLASTVMFVRVVVVAYVVDAGLARALIPPLGAMALVTGGAALLAARRIKRVDHHHEEVELTNPFSLLPALKWGVVFAAVLVATAAARDAFGEAGVVASASMAGLVDVDAVTLATARQAQGGGLAIGTAALAVTAAVVTNTLVKGAIAWVSGGRRFARGMAVAFAVSVAVGLAIAAIAGRWW